MRIRFQIKINSIVIELITIIIISSERTIEASEQPKKVNQHHPISYVLRTFFETINYTSNNTKTLTKFSSYKTPTQKEYAELLNSLKSNTQDYITKLNQIINNIEGLTESEIHRWFEEGMKKSGIPYVSPFY